MEPKVTNYATKMATKIYNYYYTSAIKEFSHLIADKLAKIPADFVYHQLLLVPDCYSTQGCSLEYYNELIDSEFNSLDPNLKRRAYEKAFGVQSGNISVSEINLKLRAGRKNTGPKKLYDDAIVKEIALFKLPSVKNDSINLGFINTVL